jgi:hypothetical protein
MKKITLFISILLIASCIGPREKKRYDFEIVYANGDTIYQSYTGVGDNMFSLKSGDLTTQGFSKTLVSGIRSYRLIGIQKLGLQTKKEVAAQGCRCELKLVPVEKEPIEEIIN